MHKKKYIRVNVCAGIEEGSATAEGIHIFPNPATGYVSIVFPENLDGNVTIDLVDLRGTVVMHKTLPHLSFNSVGQLDISALVPGIYIVRVIGEKAAFSEKLVVY